MKKFTKNALILTLALVLLIINTNFAFAIEFFSPDVEFEEPTFYDAANSTLDLSTYFNINEFNEYMVEQLKTVNGNTNTIAVIDVSQFNIPKTDAVKTALQELIWYNLPELFRIGSMGFGYSGNKYTQIQFYSRYTKEEYAVMYDELILETEKLLIGVKDNTELSDVEKALVLHDKLALHCSYDYENLINNSLPVSARNAYGIIVLKTGVCMGYALAYDYLLEQVGIKTLYCSSDTLNHAWNIVYINNTPYHVDVTWDDPVWDMYGKVTHENFLLSTKGLKATGHTATDFFSFPTDTTYDNYYWQDIQTSYQVIDNEFYYFDTTNKSLCKLNDTTTGDSTILKEIKDIWTTSGGFYDGSYTKLLSDNYYLYYNTKDTVYRYNPQTDVEEIAFSPDVKSFGSYHWIYGMNYSDCKITCEVYSSPNYTAEVKKSYTITEVTHAPSEWVTTKEPTMDEEGEKQRTCLNCSQIISTENIPKIFVTPIENTDTIIEDDIVFTSVDLCKDIESVVNFSDNVTYEISASFKTSTTEFLGTGTTISIYENGEKVSEYKIIVAGDLNGDSVCDVLDVACTELSLTNNRIPSVDECYAANGSKKAIIDEASFQYVVNTAMKVDL